MNPSLPPDPREARKQLTNAMICGRRQSGCSTCSTCGNSGKIRKSREFSAAAGELCACATQPAVDHLLEVSRGPETPGAPAAYASQLTQNNPQIRKRFGTRRGRRLGRLGSAVVDLVKDPRAPRISYKSTTWNPVV